MVIDNKSARYVYSKPPRRPLNIVRSTVPIGAFMGLDDANCARLVLDKSVDGVDEESEHGD